MYPTTSYPSCLKEEVNLPDYDKRKLGKQAQELGFVRDTLEKVYRLAEILKYLNTNPLPKTTLALYVFSYMNAAGMKDNIKLVGVRPLSFFKQAAQNEGSNQEGQNYLRPDVGDVVNE